MHLVLWVIKNQSWRNSRITLPVCFNAIWLQSWRSWNNTMETLSSLWPCFQHVVHLWTILKGFAHYCTHLWKNSMIVTPELQTQYLHNGWILLEKYTFLLWLVNLPLQKQFWNWSKKDAYQPNARVDLIIKYAQNCVIAINLWKCCVTFACCIR
jgi:hypothetical protein